MYIMINIFGALLYLWVLLEGVYANQPLYILNIEISYTVDNNTVMLILLVPVKSRLTLTLADPETLQRGMLRVVLDIFMHRRVFEGENIWFVKLDLNNYV